MAAADGEDARFRVDRVASSLRHSVTDSIRTAISVRRFQPGQRLIERELCDLTGVSRTLVREALRQLETEGLIAIQPHRGPVVRELTRSQANGVYDVRRELEGLAAALFAARADQKQRDALEDAFSRLKVSLAEGDQVERLRAKNEFYEKLLQGTGNEALAETLKMLNARVTFLRATSLQVSGRAQQSIEELERLMRALDDRDAQGARAAAELHVTNAAAAAVNQFLENSED
ncbi:GntR family transcriptional regulator [Jiella pacifica]|uniref:FCD domain-containing protein n=1 Tax=Jiella pacifica TaxID=2696469 RepID=A0A6N9SYZ3_9HYPH|nr:GntR family transcriptional regulator [Jiella pacifica]NDW03155.1 FCD domain-containing protein [Jiella pacifica]